ncbi:hypothetical protein Tco_0671663 [Tanacetum coccineum]
MSRKLCKPKRTLMTSIEAFSKNYAVVIMEQVNDVSVSYSLARGGVQSKTSLLLGILVMLCSDISLGRKGPGSGYHQKDRKPRQNDKTEHGMEKTVQNQAQ